MHAFKFELVLALTLVSAGMVVLPLAIFWVGQFVVGEFEGGGAVELLGGIWMELGRGSIAAWALVLSPYLVIQLMRLARAAVRRPVNDVTVSSGHR
jgi:hypothetical protein